jgi:hypothetical protein
MTASQLLQTLAAAIQAALPGWRVSPVPLPDPADRQVTLGYGPATAGHAQYIAPALEEQVRVTMSVRVAPGAYEILVDARDAVVRAVYELYGDLMAAEVEFLPPASWQAPRVEGSSATQMFWVVEVYLPMRRRL